MSAIMDPCFSSFMHFTSLEDKRYLCQESKPSIETAPAEIEEIEEAPSNMY